MQAGAGFYDLYIVPSTSVEEISMNAILTWTANTDDTVGYNIYRGLDGAVPTLLISVGNVTTYTDVLPSANGVVAYSLSAFDVAGNESAKTVEVTKVYDANPPMTPAGLIVVLG